MPDNKQATLANVKTQATNLPDKYEKAATQGNADAQCQLGYMYYNGSGVTQDLAKACEWFEKAAAQGNANAQCLVGHMYYNGSGVTQDYAKASERYEKAAAQGNANAQCLLGHMYYEGNGVTKDLAKAREWFEKAAAQENSIAKMRLKELPPSKPVIFSSSLDIPSHEEVSVVIPVIPVTAAAPTSAPKPSGN